MMITATQLMAAALGLAVLNVVARSRILLGLLNLAAAVGFGLLLYAAH